MRVLIVEDDDKVSDFITKGLKQEGFAVDHAADGNNGYHLLINNDYDVAILDIMLPGMDGLSIIEKMRKRRINIPVLVLSAKSSIDDRVKGLTAGGDDYMIKPFAFSELVARIHALLRRTTSSDESSILEVDELKMDLHRRKVFMGDEEIFLQPKELILLEYLMRNQGRVLSKTMIMEHVWDINFDPHTNVVEAKVAKLRSKLAEISDKTYIYTVKGLGYVCENRS